MSLSNNERSPKVKAGDTINIEPFKMPTYCLFRNFRKMIQEHLKYVLRTYEGANWYFLTFSPFNKNYQRDLDKYKDRGLDIVRRYLTRNLKGHHVLILTKEIEATKVHINALICTPHNLVKKMHKHRTNEYFIHCEYAQNREAILRYIFKEAENRYFKLYKDYYLCVSL